MAREPVNRTKPEPAANPGVGGLDEFAPRERVTKSVSDSVSSGWSSDRRPKRPSADRPDRFTVPEGEEVLIKFVEDQPFASIFQHWVMTQNGRRPYTCLETEDCPMCSAGDRAKSMDHFNIIQMTGDGVSEPVHKVWYATADPTAAIREKAKGRSTSPINKDGQYFAVSKVKGANGFNTYSVERVREDELDDWGVQPLTAEGLSSFKPATADIIRIHTKSELAAAVRENFE